MLVYSRSPEVCRKIQGSPKYSYSDTYVELLAKGDNNEVVRYLIEDGISRLVRAGAQCLVICSNTAHVAVAEV